jgi:hypothetical protein
MSDRRRAGKRAGSKQARRSADRARIPREAADPARDPREAARRARTAERGRAEGHLHPRDRGPVRALVRDAVDARRRLVGLFLPALGATLISALGPASDLQRYLLIGSLALLAAVLVDAVVLGVVVTRTARAAFPDEVVPALATGWYAFVRAHRSRRVRRPSPRVGPGP